MIRIGTAGWSIPKQAASCFPGPGSHLHRYGMVLNCCEINSTFYRPHKPETWTRWASSVPEDFKFSIKLPRAITHEGKLECDRERLMAFLGQVGYLGDKLGPLLMQLPPSLEFDELHVAKFVSMLRGEFGGEIVCEPRHANWFTNQADSLLREFRIARAAADPVCAPGADQPGGCADLTYFRLHGSPRRYYSAYSTEFLRALAEQLKALGEAGQVWCIFDNTASGAAIENALELARMLDVDSSGDKNAH